MAAAATLSDQDALEQLRYQARAISAAIWQPAVCRLVDESGRSRRAYQYLRELLLSPEPELRYRGVVGLQEAATVDGEALVGFVQDRWEEPETLLDPVYMEALSRACQRLPKDRLDSLLAEVWGEGAEILRCSTIPLLWLSAPARGVQAVERALRDPSPMVRAHLALHLVEDLSASVAFEVLSHLVQDPDAEVRCAVAVGLSSLSSFPAHDPRSKALESPEYRYLFATLQQDSDDTVRNLVGGVGLQKTQVQDGTTNALQIASELDRRPQESLKKLSPWLTLAGSWHRLKAVAEFSCHPEVAQAARALAALCDESAPFAERLLRCLGSLKDIHDSSVLVELKELARLCLRLVELENCQQLSEWAQGDYGGLSTSILQCGELVEAVKMVRDTFQKGYDRAATVELVERLRQRSTSGPLPERELIEPVLAHLASLLSEELG